MAGKVPNISRRSQDLVYFTLPWSKDHMDFCVSFSLFILNYQSSIMCDLMMESRGRIVQTHACHMRQGGVG